MAAIRLHIVNTETTTALPKTYAIRTLGCQMNVHDSERMTGLFEQGGLLPISLVPAAAGRITEAGDLGADALVINTCSARESAVAKLFSDLGQFAVIRRERPGMQIAIGDCLAQQMREDTIKRAPWVDAVFGTRNINALPVLLKRVAHNYETAVEIEESLEVFPSTLPTHQESAYTV